MCYECLVTTPKDRTGSEFGEAYLMIIMTQEDRWPCYYHYNITDDDRYECHYGCRTEPMQRRSLSEKVLSF